MNRTPFEHYQETDEIKDELRERFSEWERLKIAIALLVMGKGLAHRFYKYVTEKRDERLG